MLLDHTNNAVHTGRLHPAPLITPTLSPSLTTMTMTTMTIASMTGEHSLSSPQLSISYLLRQLPSVPAKWTKWPFHIVHTTTVNTPPHTAHTARWHFTDQKAVSRSQWLQQEQVSLDLSGTPLIDGT